MQKKRKLNVSPRSLRPGFLLLTPLCLLQDPGFTTTSLFAFQDYIRILKIKDNREGITVEDGNNYLSTTVFMLKRGHFFSIIFS